MYTKKRIKLLSNAEIDAIYAIPIFNKIEQSMYFEFNAQELKIIKKYRTIKTQISLMLSLGYFKAKQQFYNTSSSQDLQYIKKRYFNKIETKFSDKIDEKTYRSQKIEILKLFNYQNWSPKLELEIKLKVCKLLRYYPKPHGALRQLLDYLDQQRIIIPSYRKLQDIFTYAFTVEKERLNQLISEIPEFIKKRISLIVSCHENISLLNIIRADQKNFQYTALKTEIKKAQYIAELYEFSKRFVPSLGLSKNAINYYAEVTEQYAAYRLRKINQTEQWLHIICFVYYRYRQIMDNLITSFMYRTKLIIDAANTFAEVALTEHNSNLMADFPSLAKFLQWFPVRDKTLTNEELDKIAYNILPLNQFPILAKFFHGNTFDKRAAKWKFYLKSARTFSLYLRPIIMIVPLIFYEENSKIMELITFLKSHYAAGKSPSSLKLSKELDLTIPPNISQYLKKHPHDNYFNSYLFEFFVYQKIYHYLDRGKLCCNDSLSFCDISYDLVDDKLVDHIENIATEFGYSKIPIYCDERLDDAVNALDNAWKVTTQNIQSGLNSGFYFKKSKSKQLEWALSYDSSEKLEDAFFKFLPKAEIADIMMFIGDLTNVWDDFTHIKRRYIKRTKPMTLAINACLLSEAFGFGETKMAEVSDLDLSLLQSIREDFIRIDTLCAANDTIGNYIKSLPIFKLWNLMGDKLLADADGQKFATNNHTIQSRFSKKYLGKGRGISLYTLIANFVAVNAKNMGLHEYEGHSLYDMIYNNKTDIAIDMVTGDNHSLNQLNFMALDSIDVEYLPSIKNIREAANDLYSVKPISHYTGPLQPKAKINLNLIKSQKREVLRILLSLIMQENTQSNIIRKLSSHLRYAKLKLALFEYNKIFKSTHVLNLIDNMLLRKAIRTARNRTESYHQLQSFIKKIYIDALNGKKKLSHCISFFVLNKAQGVLQQRPSFNAQCFSRFSLSQIFFIKSS